MKKKTPDVSELRSRDREIKLMHDIGRPYTELALYYDMSIPRIKQIIKEQEEKENG